MTAQISTLQRYNDNLAAEANSLMAQIAALRNGKPELGAAIKVRKLRSKLHWDKVAERGSDAERLARAKNLFDEAMTIINAD